MITDRNGRHEVLLPIYNNLRERKRRKTVRMLRDPIWVTINFIFTSAIRPFAKKKLFFILANVLAPKNRFLMWRDIALQLIHVTREQKPEHVIRVFQ